MKRKALAVKFINEDEGIIGGWGAPYGGPLMGKDLTGEYFSPNTNFCLDWYTARPVLYQHGLDATKGIEVCGTQTKAEIRNAGLWVECQLNKSQKYWEQIKSMITQGLLFFSSGASPHLVEKKSTGEITRWPTIEFTLTPTPANPLATIDSLKAVAIPDEALKFDESDHPRDSDGKFTSGGGSGGGGSSDSAKPAPSNGKKPAAGGSIGSYNDYINRGADDAMRNKGGRGYDEMRAEMREVHSKLRKHEAETGENDETGYSPEGQALADRMTQIVDVEMEDWKREKDKIDNKGSWQTYLAAEEEEYQSNKTGAEKSLNTNTKDGDMKKHTATKEIPPKDEEKAEIEEEKAEVAAEAAEEQADIAADQAEEAAEAQEETPPAPQDNTSPAAAAPQLPPTVVDALTNLKQSCEDCLSGQTPAPTAEAVKALLSAFNLTPEPSGMKAQLDEINSTVAAAKEALKGLEGRLASLESKPAHEGPVLREVSGTNPRMDNPVGASESAIIAKLATKATDPHVKAWLGQQAAVEDIQELRASKPALARGYLPS